jgi:hypothetical protein
VDAIFLTKLLLSFVVGSLWITAGTVIAEKYGTKVGGLVAGLPSTILISLFFIAWTQSLEVAVKATTMVPVVGGINCLFIVTYISLLRKGFAVALGGALFVWFALSLGLVVLKFDNFTLSLVSYICLMISCYYVVEKRLQIRSESGKSLRYTAPIILFRSLFSGFVIVSAVVITKVGGPLIGGAFTMFPAMFIGTLVITYFSHGPSFSAAVMKASVLGAISVVVYGVAARYTYVALGLWLGTFVSLAVSFAGAFFVHRLIARRTS